MCWAVRKSLVEAASMLYFRIFAVVHFCITMPKHLIKSRLVWLTLILLGIVPLLAFLQWQWIDDLARREEERLQNTLHVASVQLSFSFNQRLIQVQQAFFAMPTLEQIPANKREDALSDLSTFSDVAAAEWQAWQEQHNDDAAFVEALYYALPPASLYEDWTLARYDTAAHKLALSSDNLSERFDLDFDFMPPLSRTVGGLQAIIIPLSVNGVQSEQTPQSPSMLPPSDIPDPMLSIAMTQTVYAIVVLNRHVLQTRIFPTLLADHFASHRLQYDCGVVWKESSESPPKLVCSSNPELKETDFEQSAVALPIGFLPPRPNSRFAKMMGARLSNMPPVSLMMAGKMNMSNMTGMLASAGVDSTIARKLFGGMELRVQYKPNALQNEISRLRWRNLSLSFGALVVLGAGLVLVVVAVTRSERLQRQQMQFVAGISHEFRTPLAVLSSAGENLADGIVTSPEQVKRYGQVMKREITRLTGMVEQTLSFAGIQAGRHTIDPKPVSVQSLVEQAMMRHRSLLQEEGFLVEIQIPSELPPVLADATALATVFDNLITNAVKYSTTRRELRIAAGEKSLNEKSSMIVVSVQDAGRGIPPGEAAHIFEPFFRSHEVVDAQIHGNGLGLAIVQHIITQHGGTITVKSEVGSGTTFTISLRKV